MKLPETLRATLTRDLPTVLAAAGVDRTANAYLYEEVVEPGTVLRGLTEEVEVSTRTAVVLVDLMPGRNWAHPCEWRLYDAGNGAHYRTVKAHFPPHLLVREAARTHPLHEPVTPVDTALRRTLRGPRIEPVTNALFNHPGRRFAILYSGASNNRHVNDLEFLYRTLIDVYSFDPGDVFVLNHDGTVNYFGAPQPIVAWPGDGTAYRMPVTGPGTRAGMQAALATLRGRIREGDLLFVHTNNHGAGPGDGVTDFCLCAYAPGGWAPYFVNDFVADLATLPVYDTLAVMMEQCRSGGFITPVLNNSTAHRTHICTAVQASDYSLGGANFDPFAEDWIAGVTGHYPGGGGLTVPVDTNVDGRVSIAEAYTYANAVHHLGDTPRFGESAAGEGAYMFLGLPAHDLFLRDNLADHGEEPLVAGGISMSPDIVVYNNELLDPQATLCAPAARDVDTLGQPVEAGQTNFVYLRVSNRGSQPTGGTATVYWATPSVLPTPASWHLIGTVPIPTVAPGEMLAVGPVPWNDVPAVGHYCFVGLVGSGTDPAPDPATIHTVTDYYRFIRESNNATWKNFDVVDVFKNSITRMDFRIQGWPRTDLRADLVVDLATLPPDYGVRLRVLRRVSEGSVPEGATVVEDSELWRRYQLIPGKSAALHALHLEPSENTVATLEITVPERARDGAYRISVAELVGGMELGRLTRLLTVGTHAFLANTRSHEVHLPDCVWAQRVRPIHRLAFAEVERAIGRGFNGCRFCLPDYDTDRE